MIFYGVITMSLIFNEFLIQARIKKTTKSGMYEEDIFKYYSSNFHIKIICIVLVLL